ncbi:MAG: methionyl-tRNA formyltransferase, partial [Micromonosporaceae bacterium]|nr:methionyl-tRNA formyltransferase [Micromonosporaceae bacterium]
MTAANLARYPVLHLLDGDFSTDEILDVLANAPAARRGVRRAGAATAAISARLWRLNESGGNLERVTEAEATPAGEPASSDDVKLLHAFETSSLWKAPVASSTAALTPPVARAWMTVAEHWMAVHADTGDLRFVNATCKLLGVVWIHYAAAVDPAPEQGQWRDDVLTHKIATTAHLIKAATTRLGEHLSARLLPDCVPGPMIDLSTATMSSPRHPDTPPKVMILAGAGSAGARRLLAAAHHNGLPITDVCWFGAQPEQSAPKRASAYASAWYPPEATSADVAAPATCFPQSQAQDWDAVATTIHAVRPDVVFLVSMPIVPADVLDLAPLGFVNAHNGALPHYRGMDAVGWAILNNDPIVCSAHLARPAVDAGEILAAAPVPLTPLDTLRDRVRDTQLALLLQIIHHVAVNSHLPAAVKQDPERGRLHYR